MMTILNYNVESFFNVADEAIEACRGWWYESKFYKDWGMEYEVDKMSFPPDSTLAIVGRDENGDVGAFYIGVLHSYHFNKNYLSCSEIVWHIRKDLQGGSTFNEFLKVLEYYMTEMGIMLWGLAVPNEERYDRTGDALERRGYKLQDRQYIKIKTKNEVKNG